jgi:hypothetical protein
LRIPPYFFRGRGTILHRERREKMNKCNKFSLFEKNPPCFSNPRIDTDDVQIFNVGILEIDKILPFKKIEINFVI